MIKTKIIATVGPASSEGGTLEALIHSGVDVFRLNFSHSRGGDRDALLMAIRRAVDATGQIAAVMGDLAGQKIRVGPLAEPKDVKPGEELHIAVHAGPADAITTTYEGIVADVKPGHRLLIDDGQIRFEVVDKTADVLRCRCLVGGTILSGKGINVPDSRVSAPGLTEKDFADLDWAMRNELDYVAVSFVRQPADLSQVLQRIKQAGSRLLPIAKIEKPEALEHLDDLIDMSAAVMVARGDLGVEMDVARVPQIQKDIARRCQRAGKPVIIATQMLQSMVENPYPTRAEVSDVANAIFDRCDAVMLSAETAVGRHPVAAVATMNHVAETVERFVSQAGHDVGPRADIASLRVVSAVAHGAAVLAHELRACLLVVWSQGGTTSRLLSKCRPEMSVVGISDDPTVCRQMSLHYGVLPVRMTRPIDTQDMLAAADRCITEPGWARPDDLIVVVAGTRLDAPGATSRLFIHRIQDSRTHPQ